VVAVAVAAGFLPLDPTHPDPTALHHLESTPVKTVKTIPVTAVVAAAVVVAGKEATVGQLAATMLEHLPEVLA
jgi:hypothetical protein